MTCVDGRHDATAPSRHVSMSSRLHACFRAYQNPVHRTSGTAPNPETENTGQGAPQACLTLISPFAMAHCCAVRLNDDSDASLVWRSERVARCPYP
jgi:hypothetical protein